MLRLRTILGALAAAGLAACDDGTVAAPPAAPDASAAAPAAKPATGTPTPTDTSHGGTPSTTPGTTPGTPTPTTPRDSVALSISASALTLAPGGTATLTVRLYSNGAWTSPGALVFSSANPAVATVDAGGVVRGVALGTTTVRATVGERWLQIPVSVTADGRPRVPTDSGVSRPPSDTAGRGPSAPAYVSEFTLGGRVFDATPGPDSATFKPIAGVTLALVAVDDSGRASTPERVVGTATTDARGVFTLPKAPGGWYRLDVTPPAGSGYRFASVLVSRPVRETLQYDLALRKQP